MYFNRLLDQLTSDQISPAMILDPPRWFSPIHGIPTYTDVEDHQYKTSLEGAQDRKVLIDPSLLIKSHLSSLYSNKMIQLVTNRSIISPKVT